MISIRTCSISNIDFILIILAFALLKSISISSGTKIVLTFLDIFKSLELIFFVKPCKSKIPLCYFIVFNLKTYPNLIKFFNENKIEIEKGDMSFSVSLRNTMFEYCGKGLTGIFANRSNLFNLKFLRMFYDIIKFYKKCDHYDKFNENLTLGSFL